MDNIKYSQAHKTQGDENSNKESKVVRVQSNKWSPSVVIIGAGNVDGIRKLYDLGTQQVTSLNADYVQLLVNGK